MKSKRLFNSLLFLLLISSAVLAQDLYVRSAIIQPPAIEVGGFGNVVSGVDFDGDGKIEIYAVNNNVIDTPDELVPRVYKYELNNGTWELVWSTVLPGVEKQNTWPPLTYGDWDNDGKMEIIWGPVNNYSGTVNQNPARIVVYEEKGDGSDIMGVDNGDGTFKPNAQWTMVNANSYNLRPIRWFLTDIDEDNQKEIVFCSRVAGERFGIISVNNIPDNADGSETWTMEATGLGMTNIDAATIYDMAILDNVIYLFSQNGTISTIKRVNGVWTAMPKQLNAAPGGSWLSAQVIDLDNDGQKEILFGSFISASDNHVYLLRKEADTLKTYQLNDLVTGGRIMSSDYGDVDGNGKLDIVFGTRDGVPDAGIYKLEYQGGDITNPANYTVKLIDSGYPLAGNRWAIIDVENLNADADKEVLYSSSYGSATPLIILNNVPIGNATPIATVKVDANGDYQPDNAGQTFTVLGIVNSVNFTASANRFSYYIQDETGGINITKGSETGGGPVFQKGDRLLVTGKLEYFRGTSQLTITNIANDVIYLDSGNPINPIDLTIRQYLANPELYEGRYIQLKGVGLAPGSPAWPAANSDANMQIWDGFNKIVLRVDKDTDLDNNAAPTFPINVKGVATQYTSASTVHNDGYQITPSWYEDIASNVPAPPSPYFNLLEPANNAVVNVTNANDSYTVKWRKALDFNGDNLIYQFLALPNLITSTAIQQDTTYQLTAAKVLQLMGTNPNLTFKWTVRVKGAESQLVSSVDTFTVTFVNKLNAQEDTLELVHNTGDLQVAIFNMGVVGAYTDASGNSIGTGVVYKNQNGIYSGGLIYGTAQGDSVNGNMGSFNIGDLENVTGTFGSGFTSDANFNQITTCKVSDTKSTKPYGFEVIQKSYSSAGSKYVFVRYGFINKTANPVVDLYAGLFADWDIDANTYATNKAGYDDARNLVYQYDQTKPYYYGLVAINGASGYKAAKGSVANLRKTVLSYLKTKDTVQPTTAGDYRCWIGSKIDNIPVNDTAWVTFAVAVGDNYSDLLSAVGDAFTKANSLNWTNIVVGVDEENTNIVPSQFYVDQNYPNPFNPTTTIRFGLPQASNVDLRIYNILGQEVAVLVNGEFLNAGSYNIKFDASNLSSGTYIYRLQAGSNVVTKKMMLIK